MTKPDSNWSVLPHGPLERLANNLWRVEGTLPRMSLKRVMTVARRTDGGLVIHNAIALEEPSMRELEALGTPSQLIVPSGIHRLDAARYKARYPALKVYAPKGSRKKVAELVEVDGRYEDFPPDDAVQLEMLQGVRAQEGAMLVRSEDGVTLVLNDIVMNMDRKRDVLGFVFTSLLGSAPGPRISRLAKLLLIQDREALRSNLEQYAARQDLVRLVVAHEKVASGRDAANALREAITYL